MIDFSKLTPAQLQQLTAASLQATSSGRPVGLSGTLNAATAAITGAAAALSGSNPGPQIGGPVQWNPQTGSYMLPAVVGGAAAGAAGTIASEAIEGLKSIFSTTVWGNKKGVQCFDACGNPIRRRRNRGISYAQLKGFQRVSGLMGKWGMVPRKMSGAKPARKKCR